MRQVSLCLLIREEKKKIKEILLSMKKRGFGKDKWNGTGGKIDPEKGDKNVLDSAIRETKEEIRVKIKNPEKVAIMDFYFPEELKEKDYNQQVHLYLVREWEGEPTETEEMLPQWFKIKDIPYNKMWDDDKYWMPYILEGKKLRAKFVFNKEDKIIEKVINVLIGKE